MPQDGTPNSDVSELDKLESDIISEIADASGLGDLDAVRVSTLGKKGRVSALMQKLGGMPAEERKAFGQTVNALKGRVSDALESRKTVLEAAELESRQGIAPFLIRSTDEFVPLALEACPKAVELSAVACALAPTATLLKS